MRPFMMAFMESCPEHSSDSLNNEMNSPAGYLIAAIIALIIPGYLLFTLIKPEKF
jgi:hypothetical protein